MLWFCRREPELHGRSSHALNLTISGFSEALDCSSRLQLSIGRSYGWPSLHYVFSLRVDGEFRHRHRLMKLANSGGSLDSAMEGPRKEHKSGGVEDGGEDEGRRGYPLNPTEYRLLEELGHGASSTVYSALCLPYNELVAIKVLQFDEGIRISNDFRAASKSRIRHPNVLTAYCSFSVRHTVWVVMPFVAGGSCLDIMKAGFANGFDEALVATFLKESLIGLNFLHQHGRIHQDVKAGSILVDGNGRVQLADCGFSTCMLDTGDQQQSRSTFLGSCCWMAPEIIERVHGLDSKADIWSFGITALELVHGIGSFSKYPMKVFFNSLQHGTSQMNCAFFKMFSKSFKNMVTLCLVKDPSKRPTAEQLLRHPFFKHARTSEYIYQHVLDCLSPLSERVKNLKIIDAAQLALKKSSISEGKTSQREYMTGIHNWICNSHDMRKTQAAVTIFKAGPADLVPQMDGVDWEGSCLQPKNTCPIELMDIIAERDAALMEKNTAIAERLAAYAERDAAILQRDIASAGRDSAILSRDAALAALARLEKKSSSGRRRPSSQTALDDGSKLAERMEVAAQHCTFAAEFHHPDAANASHSGIMVLDSESTHLHKSSRDKESQIEILVRKKRKATTEMATDATTHRGTKHPRAVPKKARNWPAATQQHQGQQQQQQQPEPPQGDAQAQGEAQAGRQQTRDLELVNNRNFRSPSVPTPIPYCSCTGLNQQCYRWGNGGWQSACCTTLISIFPLPLNPKKRGSRVAGRKMSAGAFDKLLEKLVSEGVNINLPVDLREHWAKHGTNRYVTLR